MINPYVKLQPDLFASDQNNYVAQKVNLVKEKDFPYYIFSPFQGGFYTKDIKLYDQDENLLKFNDDYVVSYFFNKLSKRIGLDIYQAVIIINPNIHGEVTLLARYVGGDLAYSTAVVTDYITFWNKNPHVPFTKDYSGYEPVWKPGELDQVRWGMDRHYNLDVALFDLSRALRMTDGIVEDLYRQEFNKLDIEVNELSDKINSHIQNKNNPHELNQKSIKLEYIKNYPLANYEQLLNNIPSLYVTPNVSMEVINELFTKPFQVHSILEGNPHNETAVSYGSYTVNYVDSLLANKWKITDTVANARRIGNSITNYTLTEFVSYLNSKLTPNNFTGLLPVERLGNYLTENPVKSESVLGNQSKWINWKSLIADYKNYLGYPVFILSGQFNSKEEAINAANAEYGDVKIGLIKYTLTKTYIKNEVSIPVQISGLLTYEGNSWS